MRILAKIFQFTVIIKNILYDLNILKSKKVKAWVISVGNITSGGTGKTPCVDWLAKLLTHHRVSIISRGYKSQSKGIRRVDPTRIDSAKVYGDEPTWLAANNPAVSVWVSPNRVEGCRKIINEVHPEIIIADDAFQHRALYRDVDIVVIDATEPKKNYRYLPLGRAREGFDSIKRAHAVFLTKINLVSPEVLRWLRGNIRFTKNIFEFKCGISHYKKLNSTELKNSFFGEEVILVSGIGKPENFERLNPDVKIIKHFSFKDHMNYDSKHIRNLLEYKKVPILTTQKDSVKLKNFSELNTASVWVSELTYSPMTSVDKIYEVVRP